MERRGIYIYISWLIWSDHVILQGGSFFFWLYNFALPKFSGIRRLAEYFYPRSNSYRSFFFSEVHWVSQLRCAMSRAVLQTFEEYQKAASFVSCFFFPAFFYLATLESSLLKIFLFGHKFCHDNRVYLWIPKYITHGYLSFLAGQGSQPKPP